MKYTFECKVCYKTAVCNSKEEVKELKNKHWEEKGLKKIHRPIFETMHVETRTSKNSRRPYVVLVAD